MAGIDNLKPCSSTEEARERGRLGGLASGESRRRRKTLKEELLLMLDDEEVQKSVTAALIAEAQKGNTKAFEIIRDTIDEKPVDKVQMKTDVNIADSEERLQSIFGKIKDDYEQD